MGKETKRETKASNFMLTVECRDILRDMAHRQGISMAAMLEILIRKARWEQLYAASELTRDQ